MNDSHLPKPVRKLIALSYVGLLVSLPVTWSSVAVAIFFPQAFAAQVALLLFGLLMFGIGVRSMVRVEAFLRTLEQLNDRAEARLKAEGTPPIQPPTGGE